MNKKILMPVILGSALFLAGCSYGSQSTSAPSGNSYSAPAPSGQVQSQPAQPEAAGNTVTIQSFAFSPASLTIKEGTTVTWTNKDSVAHTVTSSMFNSGNLASGAKFQFTFKNPGTYTYACSIHPSMQGTVIVQ